MFSLAIDNLGIIEGLKLLYYGKCTRVLYLHKLDHWNRVLPIWRACALQVSQIFSKYVHSFVKRTRRTVFHCWLCIDHQRREYETSNSQDHWETKRQRHAACS